jgi:hypothetical protein
MRDDRDSPFRNALAETLDDGGAVRYAGRLTEAERAEIEAECRALIAELKRIMRDPGRAGVPHETFISGWDGFRLHPPKLSRADRAPLPDED